MDINTFKPTDLFITIHLALQPARAKSKYNVLLVGEGDPSMNEWLASNLSREGFNVISNSDYLDGLMRRDEMKPDLIILDNELPVDTSEACCQLRRAVDIPILMLGRVPGETAWVQAVEAGADFYLVKPFPCSELVARVKALLRRYEWGN